MELLYSVVVTALARVWQTFSANWYLLALSALVVSVMSVYIDHQKVSGILQRNRRTGVLGATLLAVATPLCSCGTTAVVLGMMAARMSWAPLVAFMVASPLTSPGELFYSAGLFGWPFAITFFGASILLGLAGGLVAYVMENRNLLVDQVRLLPISGGSGEAVHSFQGPAEVWTAKLGKLVLEFCRTSLRLLLFFGGFAFVGYVLNGLIPTQWVATLFSSGKIYGVTLAATLGVPFYVNTEASLPLVRSLLDMGMSPGATLAFLITGAGTSMGAVAGALTIARWRVIGLVVGTLWMGAILIGYTYNFLIRVGMVP